MLSDMGIETGVDLDRVLAAANLAAELVGHQPASQVSKAGPRWAVKAEG
jgi:hydroxymethylglutaryl-CoA lyase